MEIKNRQLGPDEPRRMQKLEKLLELMGRQLGLCCHHAVGNLPRRKNEGRLP